MSARKKKEGEKQDRRPEQTVLMSRSPESGVSQADSSFPGYFPSVSQSTLHEAASDFEHIYHQPSAFLTPDGLVPNAAAPDAQKQKQKPLKVGTEAPVAKPASNLRTTSAAKPKKESVKTTSNLKPGSSAKNESPVKQQSNLKQESGVKTVKKTVSRTSSASSVNSAFSDVSNKSPIPIPAGAPSSISKAIGLKESVRQPSGVVMTGERRLEQEVDAMLRTQSPKSQPKAEKLVSKVERKVSAKTEVRNSDPKTEAKKTPVKKIVRPLTPVTTPSNKSQSCPYTPVHLNNKSAVTQLLQKYDHIICDCDGVLFVDNSPVPGVPETINWLRESGKRITFATNSNIKSRQSLAHKLQRMGYRVREQELFTTSYAAALYLRSMGFCNKRNKKAFVVGMEGIVDECRAIGITCVTDREPNPNAKQAPRCRLNLDPDVKAVLVGYDNQFSFTKLAKACSYAARPDVLLICCNGDVTYPSSVTGVVNPGPGKLLAAITAGTDREVILLGKPTTQYFDLIHRSSPGLDKRTTLMIGDKLSTDVLFARKSGIASLFVMTGTESEEDMNRYLVSQDPKDWDKVPDFYAQSVSSLIHFSR